MREAMSLMENATGETESVEAQVDLVVLAKKHLAAHPEACAWQPRGTLPRGMRDEKTAKTLHEHGSTVCISAFLGEGSPPPREGKRVSEEIRP